MHNFLLGDFHRKLPRTPSSGTMSSADDLDEREPPSPSEAGITLISIKDPLNQLKWWQRIVLNHYFVIHILNISACYELIR